VAVVVAAAAVIGEEWGGVPDWAIAGMNNLMRSAVLSDREQA
jgi:hypothetical protein